MLSIEVVRAEIETLSLIYGCFRNQTVEEKYATAKLWHKSQSLQQLSEKNFREAVQAFCDNESAQNVFGISPADIIKATELIPKKTQPQIEHNQKPMSAEERKRLFAITRRYVAWRKTVIKPDVPVGQQRHSVNLDEFEKWERKNGQFNKMSSNNFVDAVTNGNWPKESD